MNNVKKKRPGRWKPGESGKPAGRKPGTGQVAMLRAAIAEQLPSLLDTLVMRALGGDVGAARLLLERTIAPLRAVEPTQALTLPDGSLTNQGRAVLKAVAAGELAPGQGAALLGAIGALARVAEIDELTARIEALEAERAKWKERTMPSNLKSRVQALEQNHMDDGLVGGVVTYGRHETPEEAVERARMAGRRGGVLVVPETLSIEEWLEMVEEHRQKTRSEQASREAGAPRAL